MDYDSTALTTELIRHVARDYAELGTDCQERRASPARRNNVADAGRHALTPRRT